MIKLISHYHYRIDVFKEVKCIEFKVYVKIHVKKICKGFFIAESHHTWGMVRVVFSEKKSGPVSQDLVAKTLLPLKNFSYMTHSLPKATFRFYS